MRHQCTHWWRHDCTLDWQSLSFMTHIFIACHTQTLDISLSIRTNIFLTRFRLQYKSESWTLITYYNTSFYKSTNNNSGKKMCFFFRCNFFSLRFITFIRKRRMEKCKMPWKCNVAYTFNWYIYIYTFGSTSQLLGSFIKIISVIAACRDLFGIFHSDV